MCPTLPKVVASWGETGTVNVFDIGSDMQAMEQGAADINSTTVPLFSYSGHQTEGFALDWSSVANGRFLF